MCAIIGTYSRLDVSQELAGKLEDSLGLMAHRGPDGCKTMTCTHGVFGSCVLNITGRTPQPLSDSRSILTYNGEVYNYKWLARELETNPSGGSDSEVLFKALMQAGDFEELKTLLKHLDGDFAFAYAFNEGIILARDFAGVKPLYYALCRDNLVFASEKKALTKMNINQSNIKSLVPGTFLYYDGEIKTYQYYTPVFEENSLTEAENARTLSGLFAKSVRKRNYSRVAVAFSGGIDSSLIAHVLKTECRDIALLSVGVKGSHDEEAAKEAAALLGLEDRLYHYVLTEEEVEGLLPSVISTVESTLPFDVSIAFPLYVASRQAKRQGFRVVLSGQGADELFAGYKRYERMSQSVLKKSLEQDFYNISEINLERDDKATMANSVELRVPFLDKAFVEFAHTIPVELKIKNNVRKYILRRAAQSMGLPEELVLADKKAAQFSSGIHRVLRKIARKKGYGKNLEQYLKNVQASNNLATQ